MEITSILILTSDLEFDDARLRRCRLILKQYRAMILKMVNQQKYWQNRLTAIEVREKWWQNPKGDSKTAQSN